MANSIYYFSGTGNSFAAARDIAERVADTQLQAISNSALKGAKIQNYDRVGFVFPVYAWGMPRLVTDFIKAAHIKNNTYIFAIATAGGVVGATLKELQTVLRKKGCALDAGFAVKSPSYGFDPLAEPIGPIKFVQFLAGKKIRELKIFEERKDEIINSVISKKIVRPESTNFQADTVGGMLHSVALDSFKKEDENYFQSENCTSCGTCVSLCPRDNISLADGKLQWLGNCEGCRACLKWCPEHAIGYKGLSNPSQSKNSTVNLKDLLSSGQ